MIATHISPLWRMCQSLIDGQMFAREDSQLAPRVTTTATDNNYLVVENVVKSYGAFTALKGIDLEIKQGELVCFLGPSGCGKTTLLRTIAGLERQDNGRIYQAGEDVTRLSAAQRDSGIVFQSYALFPNLTVAQNIGYGLTGQRVGKQEISRRVTELLDTVGLPGSEDKYPSELSGGQQQRVALARALALSPGLLLLDEPLSALDATVRTSLRSEIKALQKRLNVTTIMVTHDQEEALSMADRIVVMNHGVIEQVGTPSEVYLQPATAFVAGFIGKANFFTARQMASGQLQLGNVLLPHNAVPALPVAQAMQAWLRPEAGRLLANGAVLAAGCTVEADGSLHCSGKVLQLEFMGAQCMLHVSVPELSSAALQVQISLAEQVQHGIAEGSRVRFALDLAQLSFFPASFAQQSVAA